MNGEWRQKSKPTDILSFPANDFESPGVFADDPSLEFQKHLGDLVVAPHYVMKQCNLDKEDFEVWYIATPLTEICHLVPRILECNSADIIGCSTAIEMNGLITLIMLFPYCNNCQQNGELDLDEDAGVSREMATKFTLEERIPLLFIHGMLHLLG
jgi:hypothetical protein